MVLVVLFPLPDEKNVDVKTIFTCSQTCLLEMKQRVLSMHPLETRIAPRQASALNNANCNKHERAVPHARSSGTLERTTKGSAW